MGNNYEEKITFSFYFTALQAPRGPELKPELNLHRIQFIPWHKPLCETHEQAIRQNKARAWQIECRDLVHVSNFGMVHNIAKYYDDRRFKYSGSAETSVADIRLLREESGIRDILTIHKKRPNQIELNEIRKQYGCIPVLETNLRYALWHDDGTEKSILIAINARLVDKESFAFDGRQGRVSDFYAKFYPVRNREFGIIDAFDWNTDAPDLFHHFTTESESHADDLLKAWEVSANETTGRWIHTFDHFPTKPEFNEQLRRHGLTATGRSRSVH